MDRKKAKVLAGEDRISRLPDDIIHRILSLFSTFDVVRLGTLSKRWKHLSDSVPFLHLTPGIKKFCKAVNTCLERRENDLLNATNSPISKFMLVRKCCAKNKYIDRCMNFVAQSGNLKELNLDISFYSNKLYSLPQCIVNMRSLTILKLRRVSLEGIVSLHLPSLISLELHYVKLNDPILHNLLSACTAIQKLCLICCFGSISNPKISSSTLKSLEIILSWTEYQIEAVNLQSLVLQVRDFNLSSCGKIQKLSLMSINTFTGGMMEDLILQLPLLEYLDISFCSKIQNLKIYKQHLKRFVFIGNDCCPESVITIHAPNLVSFRLLQRCVPSNFSVIAPKILDADINICGQKPYDFQWYLNLHNFLSQFDISKQLTLRLDECISFPTEFRRIHCPPLPTLKHLKIIPLSMSSHIKDALLWLAPSATLSIQDSKFYFMD
ncbi:hypothetical protein UlMin_046165 [Ulmus minor]